MRSTVDSPWQERLLKPRRPLPVRARLFWTLGIVLALSFVIAALALWHLVESRRDLESTLARAADPGTAAIGREAVRRISLATRDLVILVGIAGGVAVLFVLSAARWVLHPVRRITGHVQAARGAVLDREGWGMSRDEVGGLARLLAAHLNTDAENDEVRSRSHRLLVQRLEAVLEQRAMLLAAVDKELRVTFLSRRLREMLKVDDPARRLPGLAEVWPDEALAAALKGLRQSGDEFAAAFLTRQPLGGRTATLVRTGAPDAAEREIIVIVSI
jgi:PAS domain-containing protein